VFDPKGINRKTEEVAELLNARLGVHGRNLAVQLRKARPDLPRPARHAGRVLTRAQAMAEHPRLARLIDATEVTRAHDLLRDHLHSVDRGVRRRGAAVAVLAGVVLNLLIFGALMVALLRWRGLI
jgi:hypothetical protein